MGDKLRSKIAAKRLEPEVKQIREELFGSQDPPFLDLAEMNNWIQEKAKKQPKYKDVSYLAYLGEDEWTKRVVVTGETKLKKLYDASKYIARKMGCMEAQATAFILADRIPYIAPIIGNLHSNFYSDIPNIGCIEIIINEPVPEKMVINAYRKMRKKLWGKVRTPKPLKQRDLDLVEFSFSRIDFDNPNWEEMRREWNKRYPDQRFEYFQHFRAECIRSINKIYPEIYLAINPEIDSEIDP